MIDPVEVRNIGTAAVLSGVLLLSATGYAVSLALAHRLAHGRTRSVAITTAVVSWLTLVFATIGVADVLRFSGVWACLVALLLIGYTAAPFGIWHLSVVIDPDKPSHVTSEYNQ